MEPLTYCAFVDGTCTKCGYKSPVPNLHIPCNAPPAIRQAVEQAAKRAGATTKKVVRYTNPSPKDGAGSALKELLAGWPFRILSGPSCSCNKRAVEMDRRGIDWCESNIETIVGWLREEAGKRRLPFLDVAGRLLVKRAIRNARKAAAS